MGLGSIPYALNSFIPPVVQMVKEENQTSSLKVILELAHQTMRYAERFSPLETRTIEAVCDLVGKPELTDRVRMFFTQEDEQSRQKILAEISEAI